MPNWQTNWRHWNFFWVRLESVRILKITISTSFNWHFHSSTVLRFGRCIDFVHAAQKTIHLHNLTLRFTITISKLAQALYLYADHIIWLSRSGINKSIDAKKWNDRANKFWLLSIVMNLCRDFYEISKLINTSSLNGHSIKRTISNLNTQKNFDFMHHFYSWQYAHRSVLLDTTKNICDFFIPLTALGYTNLKPRTVGILGVISSLIALSVLIQPSVKLTPWLQRK